MNVGPRAARRLGCVTGRFQPVHRQHLELFGLALARCDHLIIAITNPDSGARHKEPTSTHRHTPDANPFTYFERALLLRAALDADGIADRSTIVPFDLTRREHWPEYVPLGCMHVVRAFSDWERQKADWLQEAGYQVTVLDGDPQTKLSATDIRALLAEGDERWQDYVPAAVAPVLRELLDIVPMNERRW